MIWLGGTDMKGHSEVTTRFFILVLLAGLLDKRGCYRLNNLIRRGARCSLAQARIDGCVLCHAIRTRRR
jgi:hypothetical protein